MTTAVGGALGVTVCAPPYPSGGSASCMLGSKALLIPGIVLVALGLTLEAGATGAVRAIKMSVSLTGMPHPRGAQPRVSDTEA